MNDFAATQADLDRMEDAMYSVLDHLTVVSETWDMSQRELLGILAMTEMRLCLQEGISVKDFAALNKIRMVHAEKILK